VLDTRDSVDRIGDDPEPVTDSARFDRSLAGCVVVERERHGHQGLPGVALRAARRTDVGFAARDADRQVGESVDYFARHARAVVLDRERARLSVDLDLDDRREPMLLAVVEGVVDELLQRRFEPLLGRMADQPGKLG
jgi:hypothetical protein